MFVQLRERIAKTEKQRKDEAQMRHLEKKSPDTTTKRTTPLYKLVERI